jgi:cytochrome c oxidase cbb3-type subunit I
VQVMLLWAPVRGVLQAVVGGWFVQSVWALWLVPLALAGIYYVVPKITGRVVRNYVFWTSLSFWTLIVVGPWTGGRHLVSGPVPAWIPTIAIVSCSLLLFHYVMVFLNLRGGFRGGSVALKFIAFGIVAYVLGGFVDAVTGMRGVAKITQFTYFSVGQQQLALYGGVTMLFFGSLYYLLPRVAGRAWASAGLVRAHFGLLALGVVLLVVSLIWAGWVQGHDLNVASIVDGKPVLASFADIAAHTKTPLLLATVAQAVLLLGNLAFAANFVRTVCRSSAVPVSDLLHQPSTLEASA